MEMKQLKWTLALVIGIPLWFGLSAQIVNAQQSNLVPLLLFYSSQRGDNFSTSTMIGKRSATEAGYGFARVEGCVFQAQQVGTVPLKLFYSSAREDNFTTATAVGERSALEAGYGFARIEGYVYPDQKPGTVPLKLFYSGSREDNFTTSTTVGERSALEAGYGFARVEGYVFPAGTVGCQDPTNLSRFQTSIRDQGGRTTCITFAALAAVEAAYKRAGYGNLDLSEQFLNHFGKMFWLHPYWDQTLALGEDGRESQVGVFGGGNGAGYIKALSTGMKVSLESAMPYRERDYNSSDTSYLDNAWNSPFWTQRRASDINLSPQFLPASALNATQYYSVRSFREINAQSAREIENAILNEKEVVWDFEVKGDRNTPIWQACPGRSGCTVSPNLGGHSMVIVGFNRTSLDSSQHYFLVKNSWGGDFTKISYDYLQYGSTAAYIDSVNPPTAWSELSFVGRWNHNDNGWNGILDIYHLPGIATSQLASYPNVSTRDYRIGMYYRSDGRIFRVNGTISGNTIRFRIDANNPNARWDQLGGQVFTYTRGVGQQMTRYNGW
jgi:Papain family cysteine protease